MTGDVDSGSVGVQYGITSGVGAELNGLGRMAIGSSARSLIFDGVDLTLNGELVEVTNLVDTFELPGEHIAASAITTNKIAANAVTASQIAANTITADQIAANTITGDEIDVNTVIARTVRSDNYIAPTVTQNPPNQGYSLEHVEGIGYFEEVRANVIGTLTAPSTSPSSSSATYNSSFVTKEYLNVTAGDAWNTTYTYVNDIGDTHTFKAYVGSTPLLTLPLPNSPEIDIPALSSWPGQIPIESQAMYEWYSNISQVNFPASGKGSTSSLSFSPFWVAYNSSGTAIGSSFIELTVFQSNPEVSVVSESFVGSARSVLHTVGVDGADVIGTFLPFVGHGVWAGAEIPTEARLFFGIFSNESEETVLERERSTPTVPVSVTAGIRANSSVQFIVDTTAGAPTTQTVTQG